MKVECAAIVSAEVLCHCRWSRGDLPDRRSFFGAERVALRVDGGVVRAIL